jgi:hypothetical protein
VAEDYEFGAAAKEKRDCVAQLEQCQSHSLEHRDNPSANFAIRTFGEYQV